MGRCIGLVLPSLAAFGLGLGNTRVLDICSWKIKQKWPSFCSGPFRSFCNNKSSSLQATLDSWWILMACWCTSWPSCLPTTKFCLKKTVQSYCRIVHHSSILLGRVCFVSGPNFTKSTPFDHIHPPNQSCSTCAAYCAFMERIANDANFILNNGLLRPIFVRGSPEFFPLSSVLLTRYPPLSAIPAPTAPTARAGPAGPGFWKRSLDRIDGKSEKGEKQLKKRARPKMPTQEKDLAV